MAPKESEVVELVHGAWLTVDRGEIYITVQGMKVPVPCVFGPEQEPATLGWLALESASLKVDAAHRSFVPFVRRMIEHG